jgi:hypothetical protein
VSSHRRTSHYTCRNDCEQTGCPGHTLEIIHQHSSDTVVIQVDNQIYAVFDEALFHRIGALEKWHDPK